MFSWKSALKITVCLIISILASPLSVYASLAEKYPGDVGIESDPNVIFTENFEEGSIAAVAARWDEAKNSSLMSLTTDIPLASTGLNSLLITHVQADTDGAHLYTRLLPGYDELYFRFYTKFDTLCNPIHHFVHMGGYNPPTSWPQGGAGIRPDGTDRVSTGIEAHSTWYWDFYAYWMEMRGNAVPDMYWGNTFINDPSFTAPKGQWICVEAMMKMNNPTTERNGELALWVDGEPWYVGGQLASHLGEGFPNGYWLWDRFFPDIGSPPFEGFRWRSTEDLKVNWVWLLVYISSLENPGHINKVWFDDVVVAKEYIGPIYDAEYACMEALRYTAEDWLENGYYSQVNLHEDNIIDFRDYTVFASQWPDDCEFYTPLPLPAPLEDFESFSSTTELKTVWDPTGATETYYYLELTYIHSGEKSVKISSYNYEEPYYCGISRTGAAEDYTLGGTGATLSLWFRGTPSIDEIYVKLTDTSDSEAVVKYSDAWDISDLEIEQWQQWTIDLNYFTDYNPSFDLTQVKTLEVGVGDCVSPRPVGAGPVFFDDIGLNR